MAEEYFIHEVIISDSKGNLFNYHSDYMNENFSYDKEHDQISEYKPTQVTEMLREEKEMDAGKHNDRDYIKIMHSLFTQAHLNFEQCTMFFRTLIRKLGEDKQEYREYLDVNKAVATQVQDMMDYGWITEDGEYTEHCLNKLKEMGFGKTMGETTTIEEEE